MGAFIINDEQVAVIEIVVCAESQSDDGVEDKGSIEFIKESYQKIRQ